VHERGSYIFTYENETRRHSIEKRRDGEMSQKKIGDSHEEKRETEEESEKRKEKNLLFFLFCLLIYA
jgi:hypothetical protein